jgi:hypothetical protein
VCSIDLMKLQEVRPQSDYWPPVAFSPNLFSRYGTSQ